MRRTTLLVTALGIASSACSVYGPSVRVTARPPVVVVPSVSIALTSSQVALVRAHYDGGHHERDHDEGRGRGHGRGHDRGRGDGLPPGIAMNLQRGKRLPPGIAAQRLPRDVVVKLPPIPDGLEYVVVAGKLLLVDVTTQIVRDILLESVLG